MNLKLNQNIRTLRRERNITQEQLAEAMNVTVGAVSKWESGQSCPDISLVAELADFFEVSVDVLLGYELRNQNLASAVERLKKLCLDKNYDEGILEIRKDLQKYPNSFGIVFASARLLHLCGMERKNHSALLEALELYNRSLPLLPSNVDEDVDELSVQIGIGEVLLCLDRTEEALSHMKKYNSDGHNNGIIGSILVGNKDYDGAAPYLSDSFLDCFVELFRDTLGLMNCYANTARQADVLELADWFISLANGLRKDDKSCYIDKIVMELYVFKAIILRDLNQQDEASGALEKAYLAAAKFDLAPDYSCTCLKFYNGKPHSLYDDMGTAAVAELSATIEANSADDSFLTETLLKLKQEYQTK